MEYTIDYLSLLYAIQIGFIVYHKYKFIFAIDHTSDIFISFFINKLASSVANSC